MSINSKMFKFLTVYLIITIFSVSSNVGQTNLSSSIEEERTLTILTDFDLTITNEFERQFLSSSNALSLGISDIEFYQTISYDNLVPLLNNSTKGVDLAWGYRSEYFSELETSGLLRSIENETLTNFINNQIPNELGGSSLKSVDSTGNLSWFVTTIITPGFLVNHEFLDDYNLSVPETWEDLASPSYYIKPDTTALALADTYTSTANTHIYNFILQIYGWEDGWSILTRAGGNAEMTSAVDVCVAIREEHAGIVLTCNFLSMYAKRENPSMEFIVPENQSYISKCPIAIGKYCDDLEAAEAFLEFISSPQGQAVWLKEGIDFLPVNEQAFSLTTGTIPEIIYEIYNTTKNNLNIDFDHELAEQREDIVNCYFHQTICRQHALLRDAWGAMVKSYRDGTIDETYYQQLVSELVRLPEQMVMEDENCPEWEIFASEKYNAIIVNITNIGKPTATSISLTTPISLSILFGVIVCLRRRRKKECRSTRFNHLV